MLVLGHSRSGARATGRVYRFNCFVGITITLVLDNNKNPHGSLVKSNQNLKRQNYASQVGTIFETVPNVGVVTTSNRVK